MQVSPHLTFDGQCRAAFLVYQEIMGGRIATMLTYGESALAARIDAQWHDRIVHATLALEKSNSPASICSRRITSGHRVSTSP